MHGHVFKDLDILNEKQCWGNGDLHNSAYSVLASNVNSLSLASFVKYLYDNKCWIFLMSYLVLL